MALSFWKNCNLALEAAKVGDFEIAANALKTSEKQLDSELNNSEIIEGRFEYLSGLRNFIQRLEYKASGEAPHSSLPADKAGNSFSIDPLCFSQPEFYPEDNPKEDFGIILFGFTRSDLIKNSLESLKRQDALKYTEVWLDGDQGNPDLVEKIFRTRKVINDYPVKHIHSQRGNYGFRKMIILALSQMVKKYRDILILEDDCFPSSRAVKIFREELDYIREKKHIFSVYGHHFGCENTIKTFDRFQGWGWATTSQKLLPVLRQLIDCYSMPEKDYLEFVKKTLTPEIQKRIDITPPRLPSHTLTNFFAWDETLCLLTALNGTTHKPTYKRVIYNCGLGEDSSHFRDHEMYRNPPFNMISPSKVWDYFEV